ncbi:MAG: hypothetical protein RLY47_616 [Candidatus Parcubacteria bacterium]|jgi:branched-chain amino acid transport system substrate-binding protein
MTTTSKWILGIVVLALIVWVGISQSGSREEVGEIRIGMISILSGEYSVVGENIRNGALLAVEQYNTTHPDGQIVFIVEDDGYDSKKALSAYQKLTGVDNIDALINASSPSISAIYDLVTKTDIPVVQGGEQPVEPTDDNVFQIMPGNIDSERQLGAYLKDQGFKTPAVVYTQDDTLMRFKDAFVKGHGGDVKEFALSPAEKDFRTSVLKVAESNADVVVMIMFPEQGALFVKEYLTQQQELPQLAFDANFQSGFFDYQRILGDVSVLDGTIVATLATDISDQFASEYKVRFGTEPGFWSDLGYDAVNLLVSTHASDGQKWIENVKEASYSGVGGAVEFDVVGVRKPQVEMVKIIDGKLPN